MDSLNYRMLGFVSIPDQDLGMLGYSVILGIEPGGPQVCMFHILQAICFSSPQHTPGCGFTQKNELHLLAGHEAICLML